MFVSLEGIEGSGKSTLLDAIATRLRSGGRAVTTAREPGGTRVGDAVRAIFLEPDLRLPPLTEALLINASRAALVDEVLRPALARGDTVVCDRYTGSTLAYQGYGRGLDLAMLGGMCDAATVGLEPNLTLFVDVPLEVSRERVRARGRLDRMEREPAEFYARVRGGYLALAADDARWRVLDGTLSEAALIDSAIGEVLRGLPT
jgi:dTMP kinase